jgi:uncharacterized membrane protein YhaH (DUF805 family)
VDRRTFYVRSTILGVLTAACVVAFGNLPAPFPYLPILLLWPAAVLSIQRLHDVGKSGWAIGVPAISAAVGTVAMVSAQELPTPVGIIVLAVTLIAGFVVLMLLIILQFAPSQPGFNKYGPAAAPIMGVPANEQHEVEDYQEPGLVDLRAARGFSDQGIGERR